MSATFEPGRVAVATVRGVPNVRVMRYTGVSGDWFSESAIGGAWTHLNSEVTDVRPLVVLDLTSSAFALEVIRTLREYGKRNGGDTYMYMLADQIEAQTKPPRIPEPIAFGSEVDAGQEGAPVPVPRRWIRTFTNRAIGSHPWTDGNHLAEWDDLVDPVLIREGVES